MTRYRPMNTNQSNWLTLQAVMRPVFPGIGGIAAGLLPVMLILVTIGSGCIAERENMKGPEASLSGNEASGSLAEDADLLDRHAPDGDFINQAAFKTIKDHPSVFLVDIRTPGEWAAGRISGAVLIPLPELRQRLDEIPQDRHVILYCQTASRTRMGLRIMRNAGYPSVRHLRGGFRAWDGPIETGN